MTLGLPILWYCWFVNFMTLLICPFITLLICQFFYCWFSHDTWFGLFMMLLICQFYNTVDLPILWHSWFAYFMTLDLPILLLLICPFYDTVDLLILWRCWFAHFMTMLICSFYDCRFAHFLILLICPFYDTVDLPFLWYCLFANFMILCFPPGGSEWIISVGDFVDNSFTALGSSDLREVRLEL